MAWTCTRCSRSWPSATSTKSRSRPGATLCGALFRDGLVDELLLYVAPVLLGDKGRPLLGGLGINLMSDRHSLELVDSRQVGPDLRLLLRPVR